MINSYAYLYYQVFFAAIPFLFQSVSSQNNISSKEALADMMRTINEMIFFIIVGIAYIPVGLWIVIKRKQQQQHHSKASYIVAIIGSAALICLYIATRMEKQRKIFQLQMKLFRFI